MTANTEQNGVVEWSEEDECFIGSCPGIIGPCCHGDDEGEVYRELRQIIGEWLEIEKQDGTAKTTGQETFFTSYAKCLKFHLSRYRRSTLGVEEYGKWRGKAYEHILPRNLLWLNLIETFRAEIRTSLEESGVGLNQYFHHLNSSQAACFNLFWPLLNHAEPNLTVESLGIGPDKVVTWAFEKAIDKVEKTHCDLYLELKSGIRSFIEVNYTGHSFSRSIGDAQNREKLRNIYASALRKFVEQEYLEGKLFFANYQLLRNLTYFDPERNDIVIFLFPRGQDKVADRARKVLDVAIQNPTVRSRITILYLEDVVANALAHLTKDDHLLRTHLHLFQQKYIV